MIKKFFKKGQTFSFQFQRLFLNSSLNKILQNFVAFLEYMNFIEKIYYAAILKISCD